MLPTHQPQLRQELQKKLSQQQDDSEPTAEVCQSSAGAHSKYSAVAQVLLKSALECKCAYSCITLNLEPKMGNHDFNGDP